MSLTSCVLPSLRRRTSCCKSFNIAVIRAMRSGSCLAFLCSDTTFCSVRGTSTFCLKSISFSPMGSKAAGGILAPLLFLGLGGMLREGIVSSFFFTQSLVKLPKCESAFFFFNTVAQGFWLNSYGSVDWAWFTAAKEPFKNQVVHRTSFLQYKQTNKQEYLY